MHGISPRFSQRRSMKPGLITLSARNSIKAASMNISELSIHHKKRLPSAQRQNHHLPSLFSESVSLNNSLNSSVMVKLNQPSRRFSAPRFKQNDPQQVFKRLEIPISPQTALTLFSNFLNSYQQKQILQYQEIFYMGFSAQKQPLSRLNLDDQRGDYNIIVGSHIGYRFEIIEILGKGSFGQVCKCLDHKTQENLAIKIIRNKKRFHRQGTVEVRVLARIAKMDIQHTSNAIHMKSYFNFRNHLCIVFDLLSINLYDLLKSNSFSGISLGLIRRFAIQLLQCLKFTKKLSIIHCDLKPENILLSQANKSGIKVIDFGSACFSNEKIYTYIQSRFYRAPEIILGLEYSTAIDIWSFGCILAELFTGYPLFPGQNQVQQLLCIMETQGVPPQSVIRRASRISKFFQIDGQPIVQANSKGKVRYPGSRRLSEKIKCSDLLFLDMVESKKYLECLQWDPDNRSTPEELLAHPWISQTQTRPLSSRNGYKINAI